MHLLCGHLVLLATRTWPYRSLQRRDVSATQYACSNLQRICDISGAALTLAGAVMRAEHAYPACTPSLVRVNSGAR
jgi:ABC-type cobalamin transport system permease subunit